ncbi:MAG: cytochrome-c peroxidase [Arcobacteraceae bacterium]|nr:cytochrome-c peroxidase [Arcobacteraceae bacterium]
MTHSKNLIYKTLQLNIILFLCISINIFASSDIELINRAKKADMMPIPQSKLELLEIIDDKENPITNAKVELGKKLFFEPRLSKSGLISCNSCHHLGMGGVDGISVATGDKWSANPLHLNSPTVYNAVFNFEQFWDGRSPHLADQAQGPIQAPFEMAASQELVLQRITSIPQYVNEFKKAYTADIKITFKLIADTIAIFEKTLITPSRFDKFLHGDTNALNKDEKEGLSVFLDLGCARCHKDIALGGSMQPFDTGKRYKYRNLGAFAGNNNHLVKTPTLRNIEQTAPYFHNGAIWDLKEAVKEMGKIQLVLGISNEDAKKVVTFLKSLTGEKPNIIYPQLPVSSKTTPRPLAD